MTIGGLTLAWIGLALLAHARPQDPSPEPPAERPAVGTPPVAPPEPAREAPAADTLPKQSGDAASATPATAGSAAADSVAPRSAPPAWDARYRTHDEVSAWVAAWVACGAAEPVVLPPARSGRPAPALQFGAPGPVPLASRPTIFLLGGLDGLSLAGSEGVLRVADDLVRARDALPAAVAFVCVPWAAPDGLARTLAGEPADGRDRLPTDDDGDLELDEDGPDDVDGDGVVLEMLVEDPQGAWARGPDPRFLVPATSTDRVRYARAREGRDDDRDGRFNEDPAGGVVLDLSFPVGWGGEPGSLGGALPLDDELSRAIADLVLVRPRLAVLVFQGNHGLFARAGGVASLAWSAGPGSKADDVAVQLFAAATGRAQDASITLRDARGQDRPGAALDWFHAVAGVLAGEVGVWGPLDDAPDARRLAAAADAPRSRDSAAARADLAWARWLDDVRGGIGFVDWHPVDLGDGRSALVGGWLPLSRANPPVESLAGATRGLGEFVRALAAGAPTLELRVVEASRDGEVVTVRTRLLNTGRLPTGLGGAEGARVTLELPSGARLLWGESDARLGVLEPGATSREITTVALVPPGGVLRLSARAPWAAPLEREVKP